MGNDSHGASSWRKPWFMVWFCLSSKAGDDEKQRKVPTSVWEDAQPFSGPHLEVGEGQRPQPQVLRYPRLSPGIDGVSGGLATLAAPPPNPCPGPFQLSTSDHMLDFVWGFFAWIADLLRC